MVVGLAACQTYEADGAHSVSSLSANPALQSSLPPSPQPQPEQPAQQLRIAPVFFTCFTIHPVDPPKGEEPRSCDSYCMEKIAVCTGVQSNIGPPPSCEDGMYKGSGSCRCCKVQQ
jgi:hypothetical protein